MAIKPSLWHPHLPLERREDILISEADARALDVRDGDALRLTSPAGTFEGIARISRIRADNLQVHWPEGGSLLAAGHLDPESLEPDYNAAVSIEKIASSRSG